MCGLRLAAGLLCAWCLVGQLLAQTPTGEYIYLGERVVAVEPGLAISGVTTTNLTSAGATIQWTTNVESNSQVIYGLTSSYGNQTSIDPTQVTSHSMTLNGLTANTTYHFKVRSNQNNGSVAESIDYVITTQAADVGITNVQVSSITATGALIQWTTSVPSDSQVFYGTNAGYGNQTIVDQSQVTGHAVSLTGLSSNTTYHYKVRSVPSSGSAAESTDFTFSTSPLNVDFSGVQAAGVTSSGATIQWNTNVASNSQVAYGTTSQYGNVTALNTEMVTSHSVALSGLTANTLFHYKVMSTPAGGTVANSGDYSFSTSAGSGLQIINVQAVGVTSTGATIQWSTNVAGTSQVNYGTTTSYGNSTVADATLTTSHSQSLSGLTPGTIYHYQVISAAQGSGAVTSADATFATTSTLSVATTSGATTAYLHQGESVQFNAYINGSTTASNSSVIWTASPSSPVLVVQDAPGLFRSVNTNPTYTSVTITAALNSDPTVTASVTILLNANTVSQSIWMEPDPATRLMLFHWVVPQGMQGAEWYKPQYIFLGNDLSQPTTACEVEEYARFITLYNPEGTNVTTSSQLSTFFQTIGTKLTLPTLENLRCRVVLDTAEAYVLFNGAQFATSTDRILAIPLEAKPGFTGAKRVFRKISSEAAYQEVGEWAIPTTVSAPTFSPSGGTYNAPITVTMASATSGAAIRYTTDGSNPTASYGTIYGAPVTVTSTSTMKAIAYKTGMTSSGISSATYTINAGLPPTLFLDAPTAGATVSGTIQINGWALDNENNSESAISRIEIKVDGNTISDNLSSYGGVRTDVCGVYPGRPGCPNVGFTTLWNTVAAGNGSKTITVTAYDSDSVVHSASTSRTVIVNNLPTVTGSIAGPSGFSILPATTTPISIYIKNVTNAAMLVVPTWSEAGGQDDIVWYQAANLGGGTWKVTVNPTSHPGNGQVFMHVYGYTEWPAVNSPQFVDAITFKREDLGWPAVNPQVNPTATGTAPQGLTLTATTGTLDVYVLGVLNANSVSCPTWTEANGQDDIAWYPAVNLGDGTWKASVNLGAHLGTGSVNVHCYMWGGPGNQAQFGGYGTYTRN